MQSCIIFIVRHIRCTKTELNVASKSIGKPLAMPERTLFNRLAPKLVAVTLIGLGGLGAVPPAAAHGGTLHAGTPHWILLAILLLGAGILTGSVILGPRWADSLRPVLATAFFGAVLLIIGAVGLTELQIEPLGTDATPFPRVWFTYIAIGVGGIVVLASLNLGIWRWPRRPAYTALGTILGMWIMYPALFPAREYRLPVGYVLVAAIPLLVGYIIRREVVPVLAETTRTARQAGIGATLLFTAFLLFSTGQFTLNPEPVATSDPFVVVTSIASPLVAWPAVEVYLPSIPFFGALSVGTVITFTVLAGLVGINTVLATTMWQSETTVDNGRGVIGGIATTGATACCCCAPAVYGVAGVLFGLSASPLYWTFLDPASPLGAIFFVGATVFMTWSALRLARGLTDAGVCVVPGRTGGNADPAD